MNKDGYFGHRLEPVSGRVLHGAGQDPEAFKEYCAVVSPNHPAVFMHYMGLKHINATRFSDLSRELSHYSNVFLIPQIGVAMTSDGFPDQHYEQDVAAGKHDAEIEILCAGLAALGRPVFLRLGYEFNGAWNGYQPATFKSAWIRIERAIRRHHLDHVAMVWCFAPASRDLDFMAYYPGDEYVDWWSIDLFIPREISCEATAAFMAEGARRHFPVMIGESTPRSIGVLDGQASWDQWFGPYFQFIQNHPIVKSFCYINWEWSTTKAWSDWGDARIQDNPIVLENFRRELTKPRYFHGATRAQTYAEMGLPEASAHP